MKFTALAIAALAAVPAAFVQADGHYYYEKDYYKEEDEHKDASGESGKKGGESGKKGGESGGESGKKGGESGGESGKKGGGSSPSSSHPKYWKLQLSGDGNTEYIFKNGVVLSWSNWPALLSREEHGLCVTGDSVCFGGEYTNAIVDTGSDYLEFSIVTDCNDEAVDEGDDSDNVDPFMELMCPDTCDDMKIVKSSCEFIVRPPPKYYYKKHYRELADGAEAEDQTVDEADRELEDPVADGYYKKGGYCYWYLAYGGAEYDLKLYEYYPPHPRTRCYIKGYVKLACGKGFQADGDDGNESEGGASEGAGTEAGDLGEVPELSAAGDEAAAGESPGQ